MENSLGAKRCAENTESLVTMENRQLTNGLSAQPSSQAHHIFNIPATFDELQARQLQQQIPNAAKVHFQIVQCNLRDVG